MNDNSIIPFKNHAVDMNIKIPEKEENFYKGTCTSIENAWVKFTHIDDQGVLWLDVERIHSILRTTKGIARYQLVNIDDKDKKIYGKRTYVRAYKIRNIIDEFIQHEKISTRKEYLKYSEKLYMAIRDCNEAEIIRQKYIGSMDAERKKLKNRRIKTYHIEYDELTGEKLYKKTAEFAHIRSYAIYKEVAVNIENGLVVNKWTHYKITKENVNDENELLALCEKMNWNTDWYTRYNNYFKLN